MTRSQLIAHLARRCESLSHQDAETAVKVLLEHLTAHLAGGGRVEIRGFGAFSVRPRRARLGRHPLTGAPVARPATHAVHFRPGKALRSGPENRSEGPARPKRGDSGAPPPDPAS